ncbi:Spore protein YkvP [compost metagenome]
MDRFGGRLKEALYWGMAGLKGLGLPADLLAKVPLVGRAAHWPQAPRSQSIPELSRSLRPSVFGLAMFQTLQQSRLSFNSHIDLSPRSASNMRMFEATGVGSCLVTDWKENIHTLFEPDREVVTYRSVDECLEKVRWLLDHPAEREAIAKAGQARTLREHTIPHRARRFDEILRSLL